MRNIVVHAAGSYEKLRLEENPDPLPTVGEVLVDVQAAGSTTPTASSAWASTSRRRSMLAGRSRPASRSPALSLRWGEGVADLAPGAPIFGVPRFGGYAVAVGTALRRHAGRLGPPPAQIRACAPNALGSCLGYGRRSASGARDAERGRGESIDRQVRASVPRSSDHADLDAGGRDARCG